MKKKNIFIKNIALMVLITGVFAACESDFSSLDSDVVNSENTTHFVGEKAEYPIVTYNKKITPFLSNRLSANQLGYYDDPAIGSYSANFVGQLAPNLYKPVFGENPRLDSVVLTVPYFSRIVGTVETGGSLYELDSVYMDTPIKLSIYQNNYFLRDFDPNSELNEFQTYYSDGSLSESVQLDPAALEGELLYSNDAFFPEEDQIILTGLSTGEEDSEVEGDSAYYAPAMRLKLDNPNGTYWEDLFFDKWSDTELSNQNNFLDYFRGLYFKAEGVTGSGSMALLNFNNQDANLSVHFTTDKDNTDEDGDDIPDYADVDATGDGVDDNGEDSDGDGINDAHDVDETGGPDLDNNGIDDNLETVREVYRLSFFNNLITLIDSDFIPIPDGNPVEGDDKIYLKGGEGSMAIIDLFNDGEVNSTTLDEFLSDFREESNGIVTKKRLINEAFIEFYVDQSQVQGNEPDRIYVYRLDNNTPLIDYALDESTSATSPSVKTNHLQPLIKEEGEDGKGIKYKVRITEHLNRIYIRDSTNVKLGLVVMSEINTINTLPLLDDSDENIDAIPVGALLSPKGTVLHGNNSSNQEKRAKLTIYYTEPEN